MSISIDPARLPQPPRRVPLSLRITNILGGIAQIGWFIFGFGMIFVWTFCSNADLSAITFHANAQTKGRVTRVVGTGASENHQTIYENHYEYSVASKPFEGLSYSSGKQVSEGDAVDVEYREGAPERSRITGMRRGMFGPFVLFVVIFPLIGAAMAGFSIPYGRRRNFLLQDGVLAHGTLKSKLPTNVRVNDRTVWELTFEFKTRDGRTAEAKARSSTPDSLEDERHEPLLYDPNDPSYAAMLDELPSRPQINESGELVGRPVAALLTLILPVIVLLANGLMLWSKMR